MLLGLLDKRYDVAHPHDSACHAVGVEFFELIEFFADTDEFDGLSGNGFDAEGRSAACVSVQLGQNDAVQLKPLVELFSRIYGVLAGHRIAD